MRKHVEQENLAALMERFNKFGRMLPSEVEVLSDVGKRADAKMVIAEMDKIRAEIDAIGAKARSS